MRKSRLNGSQPKYTTKAVLNRKNGSVRYKAVIFYKETQFESSNTYSTKGNAVRAAQHVGAVPIE